MRVISALAAAVPADLARATFLQDLNNYLPLGSLTLRPSIGGRAYLHEEEWTESSRGYDCGLRLAFHDYLTAEDGHVVFSALKLAESQWTRVFAKQHKQRSDLATMRVYVLPDDVGRLYVNRQPLKNLRGSLEHLVNNLDVESPNL